MPSPLPTPLISHKHWLLPLLFLLPTAPIWLEPHGAELFYSLNRYFRVLPDGVWAALSMLGTGWCVYAMASPLLVRAPQVFVSWLCAAPLAGVLTRLGKEWASNMRPLGVLDEKTIHVIGEPLYLAAMPSGHTMTSFAAATAIYFSLSPHTRKPQLWLFVLALMAGLSRIAVGAHWPADVAVGAAAGVLSGLVGAWLAQKISPQHLQPQSWLMRGVAVLGFYSFYVLIEDEMGFEQNMILHYPLALLLGVSLIVFAMKSLRPASP
jgi:membrane-associated phospholipid phosphatase